MDRHVKWLRRRIVASIATQTAVTFGVVAVLSFALVYWRSSEGVLTSLFGAIVIAQVVAVARVGYALRNNPLNYVYMRDYVDRPFSYRVSRYSSEEQPHPAASRLPGFTAVATVRDHDADPSPCFDVYHDPSRLVAASVSRASGSITLVSSLSDGRIMVTDARVLPPHERLVMNLAPEDSVESIITTHRRALSARPDVVELATSAHQVVLGSLSLEHEAYVALGPALSPFFDLEKSKRFGIRLIARIDPEELLALPATIGRDVGLVTTRERPEPVAPRVAAGPQVASPPAAESAGATTSAHAAVEDAGREASNRSNTSLPQDVIVGSPEVAPPLVVAPIVAAPDMPAAEVVLPDPTAADLPAADGGEGCPEPTASPATAPVDVHLTGGEERVPAVTAGGEDLEHALVIQPLATGTPGTGRPEWLSPPSPPSADVADPAEQPAAPTGPSEPVAPWLSRPSAETVLSAPAVEVDRGGSRPGPPEVGVAPWVTRDGDDPDVERVGEPITADVPIVINSSPEPLAAVPPMPVPEPEPVAVSEIPTSLAEALRPAPDTAAGIHDERVLFREQAMGERPNNVPGRPTPPANGHHAHVVIPGDVATGPRIDAVSLEHQRPSAGSAGTRAETLGPDLSAALGYEEETAPARPRLSAVMRAGSAAGSPGKRRRSR